MLSIVVPTFNRAANLQLMLQSLKKQTDQDFEIVIADDGSTDETRTLVEKMGRAHTLDIRYIHCGPNNGVRTGRARNIGAANITSSTTHLLMFDSDLIAPPTLIAEYKKHLSSNNVLLGRVDWLAPSDHDQLERWLIDDNWSNLSSSVPQGAPAKMQGTFVGREIRLDVSGIPEDAWRNSATSLPYSASLSLPLNSCYPVDMFWEAGGFDETIAGYGYQDMIFGLRMERLEPRCLALGAATAFHVWHAKSVPSQFHLEAQCNLDTLIRLTDRLDAYEDQVDWKYWWHYSADRGGTVEKDSAGTLWAVNHCRTRRLRLTQDDDWPMRLSLSPEAARSDFYNILEEGTVSATSVDAVVLSRKCLATGGCFNG